MTKVSKIVTSVIVVFLIGIAVPLLIVDVEIDPDYNEAVLVQSEIFLDNPFERLLVLRNRIVGQNSNLVFVEALTLFGIKYADLQLDCQEYEFGIDCGVERK